MRFQEFVEILLAAGPKLPSLWARIVRIISEFEAIYEEIGTLLPQPLIDDAVDVALEAKLVEALSSDDAAFDGSLIRKVYAFLIAHPEIATMLFKLLASAKAPVEPEAPAAEVSV